MRLSPRALGAATIAVGLLGVPSLARAAPTADQVRLMRLRKCQRYEVQTRYSSIKAGAGRIAVRAPLRTVLRVVTDFGHYPEFISHFSRAKVLGRSAHSTDVYLQVPILKGAAKIWAVVRFGPPTWVNGEQDIVGHMLEGNVKRLDAKWRLIKIDDRDTELRLEMLIVPKLPVPGSIVTGEVAYAADNAVTGSRQRAERIQTAKRRR